MTRKISTTIAALSCAIGACGETPQPPPKDPPPASIDFNAEKWLSQRRSPAARTADQGTIVHLAATACPRDINVPDLLARHARAFGTEDAVRAEMPLTITGVGDVNGQVARTTRWLDVGRHRFDVTTQSADPFRAYELYVSNGVDTQGSWELGISGAPIRLVGNEGAVERFDGWLLARTYIGDAKKRNASATCTVKDGKARVWLTYPDAADLALPSLGFDPDTAELVAMDHTTLDGRRIHGTIEEWAPPDTNGVRWPSRLTPHDAIGDTLQYTHISRGISCENGGDCLAIPAPLLSMAWPKSGRVTVPMTFIENELIFRVKVGGRDVWALLDSGAETSMLDATAPLANAYVHAVDLRGRGSTQAVPFSMTMVDRVDVGELVVQKLYAGVVPIPVLASAGSKRPEIILGMPFFSGGGVRIDYANSTLTLARDPASLHPASATKVPFEIDTGKLIAEATVNGNRGRFQLDTGSGNGVSLTKVWADPRDLPGSARFVSPFAQTGAGTLATQMIIFRAKTALFGPIHYDDKLTVIDAPPDTGDIAGLLGNALFARCSAVTFDVSARTLWLEGDCARETPENKTGWHLERVDDQSFASTPWVVANVLPGSASEVSGVAEGDRLIEIGGKPAALDRETFEPALRGPAGTKVPIIVQRGQEKRRIDLVLARLLDGAPVTAGGARPSNRP